LIGTFHIVIAMKPIEGTFAENALKYGVAGINIDATRIPSNRKDTCHGGGKQTAKLRQMDRSISGYELPSGRFPANVIHNGSKGVLDGFPELKPCGAKGTLTRKSSNQGVYDKFADKTYNNEMYTDSGTGARFFKQIDEFEMKE